MGKLNDHYPRYGQTSLGFEYDPSVDDGKGL